MREPESPTLTAGDLMSRDVFTVRADATLREAARQLARREIHGAPVVDAAGRCVGVFSVSDLARWAAGRDGTQVPRPLTCSYQDRLREPRGREVTACRLPNGCCPLQRLEELPDKTLRVRCAEAHCVPTDWQVVESEALPTELVRDVMTTEVVSIGEDAALPEVARAMLHRGIHRLVVLDLQNRPVGVLAVDDLLQVMAHPELARAGEG